MKIVFECVYCGEGKAFPIDPEKVTALSPLHAAFTPAQAEGWVWEHNGNYSDIYCSAACADGEEKKPARKRR